MTEKKRDVELVRTIQVTKLIDYFELVEDLQND